MTEVPICALIVDAELQARRYLRNGFELHGFNVLEAISGAEALRAAVLQALNIIILDPALADMDGSEMLERLRSWSSVPLIVVSERTEESEKVRLLQLGADDYVVKPFGMSELLARARAVMRRHRSPMVAGQPTVQCGPLVVDFMARAVFLNKRRVALTALEFRLLRILAQHSGKVLTHQFLLREVWGNEHVANTHYLRIFVGRLRQKIEARQDQPRILVTEKGVGYRLGSLPDG
jgi:two-component system KDP operon response regulator KdpE